MIIDFALFFFFKLSNEHRFQQENIYTTTSKTVLNITVNIDLCQLPILVVSVNLQGDLSVRAKCSRARRKTTYKLFFFFRRRKGVLCLYNNGWLYLLHISFKPRCCR